MTLLHDPARVRAWAKAHGLQVGDRGRMKPEIFEAFERAHGTTSTRKTRTTPAGASLVHAVGVRTITAKKTASKATGVRTIHATASR